MSLNALIDSSRPWLILLVLLPIVLRLLFKFFKTKKASLIYSDIRFIPTVKTFRTSTLFIPKLLGYIAWVFMVIALMGPREGHEESKITTQGIAISMVMDLSASMKEVDMPLNNSKVISRYEMIQRVFKDFVQGNEKLELGGRSNDLISLVVFGKYVDDLSPLTLDHSFLVDMMNNSIEGVQADIKNFESLQQSTNQKRVQEMIQKKNPIWGATSIFDGVAMGADLVHNSEDILNQIQADKKNYHIKSKILIVLTDGEDTGSTITPEDAIKVANEFGVKIYAIAVHGKPVQRDIMGFFVTQNKQYDDTPLQKMAKETGGKFYKASDPDSLIKIYKDIDNLEKSKISKQVTMEYSPVHRPWLIGALILLSLAFILNISYYRVLP